VRSQLVRLAVCLALGALFASTAAAPRRRDAAGEGIPIGGRGLGRHRLRAAAERHDPGGRVVEATTEGAAGRGGEAGGRRLGAARRRCASSREQHAKGRSEGERIKERAINAKIN
jgi:hypothetical protein